MSEPELWTPERAIGRRDVLKGAAGLGVWAATRASTLAAHAAPRPRPERIAEENRHEGTLDWQLTYTRAEETSKWRCPWIEGYCSRQSLRAGAPLEIMVSTNPPTSYTLDIYRMGYYGGLGGRHMLHLGPFRGQRQEAPKVGPERLRECRWQPSVSLRIPADWTSGVYLGKLSAPEVRYESYVAFIVRDDRPAGLIFQCSDNTWQAYNQWPDRFSLYTNDRPDHRVLVPGVRVSFDRPYGKYVQVVDDPLSQGSGEFLLWEFPLAYWLEAHGYDVTYISNSDTHSDPAGLLRGRAFLSVGHDEYWSLAMYRNVKAAVDAGVHAAFLSGNTCCFVTPMTPSGQAVPNRTLTRAGRYGGVTAAERDYMGPFPEEGPNEAGLIGARTVTPFNGSGDWTVSRADHWLFHGTRMRNGDSIPGLVGWEFHGDPAPIPGLEVVARGPTLNGSGQRAVFTATIYPGPKQNWVFNASTIFWAQGLAAPPGHIPPYSHFGRPHGPDPRVQRITKNLFERFLS